MGNVFEAALLASHGHPTLTLAYFGLPGLPATLRDIPLEYFATAARLLAAQPQVDRGAVVVSGYSRGSEAALLLANDHPDLIRGTVLYAPNDKVESSFPAGGDAWTRGGKPLKEGTDIPVDRVAGPVLAIAGSRDRVWYSDPAAREIMRRLDAVPGALAHHLLTYPEAGHGVGTLPYLPSGVRMVHPVTQEILEMGGTRAADEAARRDSWPLVLKFLAAIAGTVAGATHTGR
ncbi:acyl-CoA thioester hydrolase/BAAT C-terminal domain-containing protein [Luedemannella flava]